MRLDLNRKPDGEWCSFGEFCGTGDGVTKEFKAPIAASEARAVLVMRDFDMVAPDGRIVEKNELDGTILTDTPDGYKLETRNETELWVVFDQAPSFETRVTVSGLGRKVGIAFRIIPTNTVLQKRIKDKQPAIFRAPAKEMLNVTVNDLQEGGRVTFMELVVDWIGVTGEDDQPLPCNAEMKKIFLDQADAMVFGAFVGGRSSAIRKEKITLFAKDSSD